MKSKTCSRTPPDAVRVIGIDPGYDRVGVAVIDGNASRAAVAHLCCIRTDKRLTHEARLVMVGSAVADIIAQWEPDAVAVESLFFSNNARTAIAVAESRGVIRYEAARRGIPLFEYGPGTVKAAVTGHGRSDKRAVESMVKRLVQLPDRPTVDDEFDAVAIALTFLASDVRVFMNSGYALAPIRHFGKT